MKYRILDTIHSPQDLQKLNTEELTVVSQEIREFLIHNVSITGGHLASNLGVVELTLAIHRVFDTMQDKVVWDVGHQSYIHKLLTGRREQFGTLRQMGGISGFPKVAESPHDCFNTGHSSTSISAALGMAKARDIKKEKYSVVAVIGDGALTGGMAFEALNDAGRSPNQLIVILNDNEMSIGRNVGGLSKYLSRIRTQPIYFKLKDDVESVLQRLSNLGERTKWALNKLRGTIKYVLVPGVLFEELGFKYFGPIDGHDISELERVLARARSIRGPVLIHVCTRKGKGYSFAEAKPQDFHGVSPFEVETGQVKVKKSAGYSEIFGNALLQLAAKDPSICAITAAMADGTSLSGFAEQYRSRFFDVGIAEQHAVTFAAGLAQSGLKPVVAIYSSFLQRAYDQILHDVALQHLHVVFCVDRAGIVGEDGETHQGIYDISYFTHMPNMTLMAPCDYTELTQMLEYALTEHCGPIALRYPRGGGSESLISFQPVQYGKGVVAKSGMHATLVAEGPMVEIGLQAAELLQPDIQLEVINLRFIKPLDEELLVQSALKTGYVVTLEDNTVMGGMGSLVLQLLHRRAPAVAVKCLGLPDEIVVHGARADLLRRYGLDAPAVAEQIRKIFK